jgi:CheY-like chemotaxis protein
MKYPTQLLAENTLEGVSVLLTEDDPMNQFIAKKFLMKWGLKVTEASNGREAVDMIQSKGFQIVLMDIHMPVMDGSEAVRQIRAMQDNYFKTVPIIAFSAVVQDKQTATAMGMTDFTSKPINPADLQKKIIQHYMRETSHESGDRKLFIDFNVYTNGDDGFKLELINLIIQNMHELNHAVEQTCYTHATEFFERIVHKVTPTLCMLNDSELSQLISVLKNTNPTQRVYLELAQRFHEIVNMVIWSLTEEMKAASNSLALVAVNAA